MDTPAVGPEARRTAPMPSRDPWAAPAPADPRVTVGPTVYATDPDAVVAFLTHPGDPRN